MQDIRRELRGRMRDILTYIRMLQFIEQAGGTASLQGRSMKRSMKALPVGQKTMHVLKAGVFLHLYNLVESTVTTGMEYIAQQIKVNSLVFRDLNDRWQEAWATNFAIDEDLGSPGRLAAALRMCQAVADGMVVEIKPKIGAGNLDDRRIENIAKRYGITLNFRPKVRKAVKHQVLDDLGFLGLVRKRRNGLAHGHESFADIGKNYSTADLTRWSWATYQYLKDLLANFEGYISAQQFRRCPAAPAVVVGDS